MNKNLTVQTNLIKVAIFRNHPIPMVLNTKSKKQSSKLPSSNNKPKMRKSLSDQHDEIHQNDMNWELSYRFPLKLSVSTRKLKKNLTEIAEKNKIICDKKKEKKQDPNSFRLKSLEEVYAITNFVKSTHGETMRLFEIEQLKKEIKETNRNIDDNRIQKSLRKSILTNEIKSKIHTDSKMTIDDHVNFQKSSIALKSFCSSLSSVDKGLKRKGTVVSKKPSIKMTSENLTCANFKLRSKIFMQETKEILPLPTSEDVQDRNKDNFNTISTTKENFNMSLKFNTIDNVNHPNTNSTKLNSFRKRNWTEMSIPELKTEREFNRKFAYEYNAVKTRLQHEREGK